MAEVEGFMAEVEEFMAEVEDAATDPLTGCLV
jgi:hypothetical protein